MVVRFDDFSRILSKNENHLECQIDVGNSLKCFILGNILKISKLDQDFLESY